jgi:hypothetical protein
VTKINAAGSTILYSTYLGGSDHHSGDTIRDLDVDSEGNAYVTGDTGSEDFPVSLTAPIPFLPGLLSAFVTNFTPQGQLGYSTYLGGTWLTVGYSIAVDSAGSAVAYGFTQSSDFPTVDPLFPSLRGTEDAFITRLNRNGTQFLFSTYFGGSDGRELQDRGGVDVDDQGNIYVTGDTSANDFPTVNPFQPFRNSNADAFVARISQFTQTPTPTPEGTLTATPTVCPLGDYTLSVATAQPMVRGTDYLPNSTCVNCIAPIQLPFPVSYYGQVFTQARASSSGNLQFVGQNGLGYNYCLPHPEYNNTIFGYWDEMHTNVGGIYTSVTGTAPNRVFNIEWRGHLITDPSINFTIRLFEDLSGRVEIVYGDIAANGSDATIGVQYGTGVRFTQYSCNQPSVAPGVKLTFTQPACGPVTTPTPGTPTPVPTSQATSTSTIVTVVTSTATACTITFADIDETNVFYPFIRCLACQGIISGYDDGTFRPFNEITRGQIAKIVSNAAGFDEDPGPQIYEDVPTGSPFFTWVNRLSMRGHIGGYPCGTVPEEQCIEPGDMPYFRPSNSATRGQLAKIVANAAGLSGEPTNLFYTDVPQEHPFYLWIMRLTEQDVMSGYPCGGEGEPCDSENRPYFRPFNNVTRGQASKIVANTFSPGCQTPGGR